MCLVCVPICTGISIQNLGLLLPRLARCETCKMNGEGHCTGRRQTVVETLINTVCCVPSRVLRAGPALSPGSLLQALEMESTLGLGVAAMQGAPCRFFPNRSCFNFAQSGTCPRSPLAPRCSAGRDSGKCEVQIPTCLEVTY